MSDLDQADGVGDESSVSDGSSETDPSIGDGSGDGSSIGDESALAWQDHAIEAAADEVGVDREVVLKRAIVALAESEGIAVPDAEEVESIRSRLDDIDADVDEKVTDLRERFVTLYRDLEPKALTDHGHEESAERLDSIVADLDDVATEVDSVEVSLDAATADLAAVENRLADVETQVDDLAFDEIEEKLSRVASAILRVRRRLDTLESERDDRQRLDALLVVANRHGVETAACGDCGETVRLGLLSAPECPHCGRAFTEIEPQTWFFGTSRLVAADPPALDGDVDESRATAPNGARDDADRTERDGADR
ncbi:hypothetical protein [Halorubrum laminariae]|uniref:CopG family transcriptional regulator n=1 Tax=Halorubrum laminariae TaxID=1433523 RepID=A0ABD6BYS3_9EURY|nr:hypothetical protein [Halorubrum laminariae]